MPMQVDELRSRVERLNNQLSGAGGLDVLKKQYEEAFHLLEEVFYNAPVGDLDSLIGPAITLSAHVRRFLGKPEMPNPKAQEALAMLAADKHLRKDPSEYIKQLYKCALVTLTLGDVVTFAYSLDCMGLAYLDIHDIDRAWLCFEKQIKIYKELEMKSDLPRAHLHLAYAAKYLAMRGQLIWQSVNEIFEECAGSLEEAELSPKAYDEIRAAYLIDRVPALIEVAKDDKSRGLADKKAVIAAIAEAKQSLREGRKIASRHPDLSHYVAMADQFEANVELIALEYQ